VGGGDSFVASPLPPRAIVGHQADGTSEQEQQDMKKWKRYRSLRRMVVALAAAAVAVPVAQAQADPGFTQSPTAQSAKLVSGIPVGAYRRLPADDQEALRPLRSVEIGGGSPSALGKTNLVRTSTPVVSDTSNTFSWGDAGMWAASGLVIMSLAVFGVLLACRSRMGQPAV